MYKYSLFSCYVSIATVTSILCIYVVLSYVRNKEYRKHPSELLLGKTLSDFVFGFIFFMMLLESDSDETKCNTSGALFALAFIGSQTYFTAICWDTYRTLSNPFRKPAAHLAKLHIFVFASSCLRIAVLSPFNVFRYRVDYGICFTCNTGRRFNFYNVLFYYIPLLINNVSAVLMVIFTLTRLSKGLEKSFDLRHQCIRRQLVLCCCSVITVISWSVVIYSPYFSLNEPIEPCLHSDDSVYMCLNPDPTCEYNNASSNRIQILISMMILMNAFFDALAWYLSQRVNQHKSDKIYKMIAISYGRVESEMLVERLPDHEERESRTEQILADALREEVIAYITAGLAKSIQNTAKETYAQSSGHTAIRKDIIDILRYEEPSPIHARHDPKPRKAVMNVLAIHLPIQRVTTFHKNTDDRDDRKREEKMELQAMCLKTTTDPSHKAQVPVSNDVHVVIDKRAVSFKDYAPHVFRYIRQQIYHISDEDYLDSVRPASFDEHVKVVKEKFSEGRSGAFFFYTCDSKYLIKTVTKQEAMLLLKILRDLVEYLVVNPHSLINRFLGLHSIKMYNSCLYFVVLENVFVAKCKPHEIYDIKGSWIDRHTNLIDSGKLLKDQDLHKTLKLLPNTADNMYKRLESDSTFLATHNIMDYSLLLGIYHVGIDPSDVAHDKIMKQYRDYDPPQTVANCNHENETGNELWTEQAPNEYTEKDNACDARVIEGPGMYYLGIIDVLQEWNTTKSLERMVKVYLRCKSKYGISCVEPKYYRKRFMQKMCRIGIRPIAMLDNMSDN
eukprot:665791_1